MPTGGAGGDEEGEGITDEETDGCGEEGQTEGTSEDSPVNGVNQSLIVFEGKNPTYPPIGAAFEETIEEDDEKGEEEEEHQPKGGGEEEDGEVNFLSEGLGGGGMGHDGQGEVERLKTTANDGYDFEAIACLYDSGFPILTVQDFAVVLNGNETGV